jgi:hypothetical protein
LEGKHIVSVQLEITTSGKKAIDVFSTPFDAHLNVRCIDLLSLNVVVRVPKVDGVAVRSSSDVFGVAELNVVSCNHSTTLSNILLGDVLDVLASARVVNLEPLGVPLHHKQVL